MKKVIVIVFAFLIFTSCSFGIKADEPISYTVQFYSQNSLFKTVTVNAGDTLDLTQYGVYKQEYIPSRITYIFSYWYELDTPLTPVYTITVNSDIRLFAKWIHMEDTVTLNFPNECYYDVDEFYPIPRNLQYEPLKKIIFYYNYYGDNRAGYTFQGIMNVTSAYGNYVIQGTHTPDGNYEFTYDVSTVGATFTPVWKQNPTIQLIIYPTPSPSGAFTQIKLDGVTWNGSSKRVSYSEHTLTFNIYPPYVMANGVYLVGIDGDTANMRITSKVVENNTEAGFYTKVTVKFTPPANGAVYITLRKITEYDNTQYEPIIVYDENSNASWAFSEVALLDTNWSDVNDNLPHKLNGFLDGLYGLSGLAVLVPLVMMVSFAIWFVRRS